MPIFGSKFLKYDTKNFFDLHLAKNFNVMHNITLYSARNSCAPQSSHCLLRTLTRSAPSKRATTAEHLLQEIRHFGADCGSSTNIPLPPLH